MLISMYGVSIEVTISGSRPILRSIAITDLMTFVRALAMSAALSSCRQRRHKPRQFSCLETAAVSKGLVQGVVGWTDLAAPSAPERVAALAATTIVKGVRPMLGFIGETDWILRAEVGRGLAAMANFGLRLDIPARIRHLPLLPRLADRHPNLAMVIDHAAKPGIACDEFRPWASAIAHVARETPMFCKISGLVTEAGENWQPDDLRPYIDHLLECFGPRRLMWGSDWPVVDLAGGYVRWWETTLQLIPQDCLDAVLGGTAIRFYGLKSPTHQ